MNAFDFAILSGLNDFANHHPTFTDVVVAVNNSSFLKAGPIVALCCWSWFKNGEDLDKNKAAREAVISAMLACFISILIARLAVLALPFRVRPLSDSANGLHFPPDSFGFQNWSSFPSDHAIMFLALTTCLFSISRTVGWIALLHSVFVVCLPRIFLGIHYPTDILAGAPIGVGVGLLSIQQAIKGFVAKGPFLWMRKHPGSFYAVFFIFMYEVTVLFNDFRGIALAVAKHLMHR